MKMLKLLPQFKAMVLNNIESSVTYEQLMVCHEMVDLFRMRYSGFLSIVELHQHMEDIMAAYNKRLQPLTELAFK